MSQTRHLRDGAMAAYNFFAGDAIILCHCCRPRSF